MLKVGGPAMLPFVLKGEAVVKNSLIGKKEENSK
jgi:hypothetical protein